MWIKGSRSVGRVKLKSPLRDFQTLNLKFKLKKLVRRMKKTIVNVGVEFKLLTSLQTLSF